MNSIRGLWLRFQVSPPRCKSNEAQRMEKLEDSEKEAGRASRAAERTQAGLRAVEKEPQGQ